MGNQHSNQLNLKQLNKKIKQKSRINLSMPNANKNKIKERGSAFLCHSNGSLIANVQFKCNFCSTVKRSSSAIRQHYAKRHHFNESSEQINDTIEQNDNFSSSSIEQNSDRSKKLNCTLFIQDNDLLIRCSSLNYGVLKLDENEDQTDHQQADQIESDLRLKRINELSKLRQELTKLNAFSRLVDSAEKEKGPIRGHSIRLRKFDDNETNMNVDSAISPEDQLNNNHYYSIKSKEENFLNKDRKIPNSASDDSNSSTSSLCQSDDVEQAQDDHLFGLNDLSIEVEKHLSETSSVDTTFGLDARCSVCFAKNYVVCIQKRLGYFKHFLSEPVVYVCDQLGKCNLDKPIKPISSHASHASQQKKSAITGSTVSGTILRHVVKQQQLGIFKSKSNTLQSTPKNRRPPKELSYYSIASYNNSNNNNNSLNDQSKSMTLNLPKNYSFKERNLSPTNQSSWTTPSPTQSNISFALKYSNSTNHNDLESTNFNSSYSVNGYTLSTQPAALVKTARCNACWIKKIINIYYEVQFDEKIINILNDYHPIQLVTNGDEKNNNQLKSNQQSIVQLNQPFNTQNNTLTKQKRYYTNNKMKSKSVSRLYCAANSGEKKTPVKSSDPIAKTNTLSDNQKENQLTTVDTVPINDEDQRKNGSSNDLTDESNTTIELNNQKQTIISKSNSATGVKTNRQSSIPKLPINSSSKGILNGKLSNFRSNSSSSSVSSNMTAAKSNQINHKNTVALNNLSFKSNAFNSINKPTTVGMVKQSSILEAELSVKEERSIELNDKCDERTTLSITNVSQENSELEQCDCELNNDIETKCIKCSKAVITIQQPSSNNRSSKDIIENEKIKISQNNTVCLIFKSDSKTDFQTDTNNVENVNTIEVLNDGDSSNERWNNESIKIDSNLIKISNSDIGYLHNRAERV